VTWPAPSSVNAQPLKGGDRPMTPPTHQLNLRFFDLDTHIRSDSKAHLELFAQLYRRLGGNGAASATRQQAEFDILTRPDNPWGRPVVVFDGEVWPLRDARLLGGCVYESILKVILARIQSHVLIHAGALACQGQGLILAADSGHGKTTLTLELVRRGFKFLSDEMAALGRADRRVHPFPRALRIRPGTLERAGYPQAAGGAPEWWGKLILDIEHIQPGSLGQAAPIKHVVILKNPSLEKEAGATQELGVVLDHVDEAFVEAVGQIEGVSGLRVGAACGYPWLKLHAARRTFVFSQIEALCRARRFWVLDVITDPEEWPSFGTPARLETIPRSQAVMELIRRFMGGYKSAILDELGSSTRLFVELADIIGQADCHHLYVGPLHEMANLVCGLVKV
jgi:hypothetical protein